MTPSLVVLHADARALLALRRDLGAGGLTAIAARSVDAALARLAAGPGSALLLHWYLPDYAALPLMVQLREHPARPVALAFAEAWKGDDLRRALQLGVTGVLTAPLDPETVIAEIESVEHDEARSRRRILEHAAPVLLAPDERLWSSLPLSDDWQARMRTLAATLRVERAAHRAADDVVLVVEALSERLEPQVVDLERLKTLVSDAAEGAVRVDRARLRALLPSELDPGTLSPEARSRLRGLRGVVGEAVDYVKLRRLKEEFALVVDPIIDLDYDALREILPREPHWPTGLPEAVLFRLRVLAAALTLARAQGVADEVLALYEARWGLVGAEEWTVLDALRRELDPPLRGPAVSVDEVERHLASDDLDSALATVFQLEDAEKKKPRLLNDAGMRLRAAGRRDEAMRCYRKALRLAPGAPALLFNLAVVLRESGEQEEARALCIRALERNPRMERARKLLAELNSE